MFLFQNQTPCPLLHRVPAQPVRSQVVYTKYFEMMLTVKTDVSAERVMGPCPLLGFSGSPLVCSPRLCYVKKDYLEEGQYLSPLGNAKAVLAKFFLSKLFNVFLIF